MSTVSKPVLWTVDCYRANQSCQQEERTSIRRHGDDLLNGSRPEVVIRHVTIGINPPKLSARRARTALISRNLATSNVKSRDRRQTIMDQKDADCSRVRSWTRIHNILDDPPTVRMMYDDTNSGGTAVAHFNQFLIDGWRHNGGSRVYSYPIFGKCLSFLLYLSFFVCFDATIYMWIKMCINYPIFDYKKCYTNSQPCHIQ